MLIGLFAFFLVLRLMIDYITIVQEKKNPDHGFNGFMAVIMAGVLTYFEKRPIDFSAFFYLFSYWFLFDTFLNISRKLPIQYIGRTANIDKVQRWFLQNDESKFGMVWIFKLIIFLFLIDAYYLNY